MRKYNSVLNSMLGYANWEPFCGDLNPETVHGPVKVACRPSPAGLIGSLRSIFYSLSFLTLTLFL